MRLKLTLAYIGSNHSGWQVQQKPAPPPTIQGAVETALFTISGQKIRVHGAGRTDAGVHALGQVAHCDIPVQVPRQDRDWRHALNAVLPRDIRIISATKVAETFDALRSAQAKTYIYQLWQENGFIPPFLASQVWACGPLNQEAMARCLPLLLGEHDFASFQNAGTPVNSTIRKILGCRIMMQKPLPWLPDHAPGLCLQITATGFLKQMCRNIAGFLVHVGKGKLDPQVLPDIFKARSRQALPSPTAPAQGLFLARVHYDWDFLSEATMNADGC